MPSINLNGELFHYASVGEGPPFGCFNTAWVPTSRNLLALAKTSRVGA